MNLPTSEGKSPKRRDGVFSSERQKGIWIVCSKGSRELFEHIREKALGTYEPRQNRVDPHRQGGPV